MSAITKRLDALEARAEPSRPLVVLFPEPGEDAAAAWARTHPGEPLPEDADVLMVKFVGVDRMVVRPGGDDGGV